VSREIVVHRLCEDEPLTIEQACQIAQALTEALFEADRMSGHDRITAPR
jgi:hypothetical protein